MEGLGLNDRICRSCNECAIRFTGGLLLFLNYTHWSFPNVISFGPPQEEFCFFNFRERSMFCVSRGGETHGTYAGCSGVPNVKSNLTCLNGLQVVIRNRRSNETTKGIIWRARIDDTTLLNPKEMTLRLFSKLGVFTWSLTEPNLVSTSVISTIIVWSSKLAFWGDQLVRLNQFEVYPSTIHVLNSQCKSINHS